MGIGIRHTILFLLVMSCVAIYLPHAKGGCGGGPCSLGGGASYDFLGDPAVNIDMSSPDEFLSDNLGNRKATSSEKSLSQEAIQNNNSSLNETKKSNVSLNTSAILGAINSQGNKTSDNKTSNSATSNNTTRNSRIVKLGATGMQNKGLSTLALGTFNSNLL